MKLLYIALAAFVLGFSNNSEAQTSQEVLDQLSQKAKGYSSIYAEYTSELKDIEIESIVSKGAITVKDQNYRLELSDYTLITDGETHWSFETGTNTCYVDYYEDVVDDEGLNPSEMFTIWENDFKHELKGTMTVEGEEVYHINLYPREAEDKSYHTIQLFVYKAKMEVMKIIVKGKEGNEVTYSVTKFVPNKNLEANDFKFDLADHPGCEMIDNR